MTKTVSARIPNKKHEELVERCNKTGCTINEWLNEAIDYLFTHSSDFDFGDEEDLKEEPKDEKEASEIKHPQVVIVE